MGMGGGGKRGEVQSEINVTPLIDVCLVLLIIFMVVTPMLQKGAAVTLPQTESPDKQPETPNQVLVSVDKDKKLFIETDWFPDDKFEAALIERKQRNPSIEILLKGDRTLVYGDVLKVMKACNEAGINNVALVTEKLQRKAAE